LNEWQKNLRTCRLQGKPSLSFWCMNCFTLLHEQGKIHAPAMAWKLRALTVWECHFITWTCSCNKVNGLEVNNFTLLHEHVLVVTWHYSPRREKDVKIWIFTYIFFDSSSIILSRWLRCVVSVWHQYIAASSPCFYCMKKYTWTVSFFKKKFLFPVTSFFGQCSVSVDESEFSQLSSWECLCKSTSKFWPFKFLRSRPPLF
jgi:hypothetical protein